MRHTVGVVLAVSLVAGLVPAGQAQQSSGALGIQATSAGELRTWDAYVTRESRVGGLRLRSEGRDPALPARTIERYDQFHNGVRIWGADLVRDSERGVATAILGTVVESLTLSTVPGLSAAAARAALATAGGPNASLLTAPELVIVRAPSAEYRLAYMAVVRGAEDVARIFLDATGGSEILRFSEVQRQAAVGTGRGVLGDQKKISVMRETSTNFADDQLRPPLLRTFDMRGNVARTLAVLDGAALFPADRASDPDNDWNDVAVVDAHVHAGWTYDYFFKRFGRRGLDDHDRPVTILTNAVTQQGALSLPGDLLDLALNAFWCGECGPNGTGVMFFGNGIPPTVLLSNGQTWTYFAGGLDVVAHELTHGVTDSSSRLIYRDESGALNEAFSDIIGTSVEFFFQPAGTGRGRADYFLGEDIARGALASVRDGFRSMDNPAIFGDPDHYLNRYRGTADNGGVHINSGIPNHAFYLAIEGGANRTSGLVVQGVGAANREQIERVFYRAFVFLLPSSATFSMARVATIQAARDLYGAGSAPERALTQAWGAVGVF